MKPAQIQDFTDVVWRFYGQERRVLPWREPEADGSFDPFKVLVSEIMLQQTQVARVVPKFQQFVAVYPGVQSLAAAPLGEVLKQWSGLGYNRRAKYLWQAAQIIAKQFSGRFPETLKGLKQLPGVGINTAGAIMAYAYNEPAIFIETNIRTVYIHHFFSDQSDIDDKQLIPLLEQTVPAENPREFYWALMDYGTHLKNEIGNKSRQSHHYVRQSPLEGSRRQIRGLVLKYLGERSYTLRQLKKLINDERLGGVLEDLQKEGLIADKDGHLHLGS